MTTEQCIQPRRGDGGWKTLMEAPGRRETCIHHTTGAIIRRKQLVDPFITTVRAPYVLVVKSIINSSIRVCWVNNPELFT